MVTSQNAFCIAAEEGDRVIGFISGAENTRSFYKEFLKQNGVKACFTLCLKIAQPKTIVKIFETLLYPAKKAVSEGKEKKAKSTKCEIHAELFSIVVGEKFRKKGVAQKLFSEMKKEFERRGIKKFKVVAGAVLKAACKFYEKMGGILDSEVEVHKGDKSLVYVWKSEQNIKQK